MSAAGVTLLIVAVVSASCVVTNAQKADFPKDLVATSALSGAAVDVEWTAPPCLGEPDRKYTYLLRVVGANDAVFLEKDDFAPSDCTGADPSVTSHRIESLESNVAYEVSVQSKTENLEDSDKASVNITLALELSTCNLPPDTTVCKCSPGEHHVEGDCEQCPQDSYSPDGLECVACPQGATSAAGSTQFSDCNCPANSINMNGVCVCEKGYGGDATLPHKVGPLLTTKISHALGLALALFVFLTNQLAPFLTPPFFRTILQGCKACQIVGYKEVDWNEPCIVCPLGASIPFHISAAKSQSECICSDGSEFDSTRGECVCSEGYFGTANDGNCHMCPFATYKDFLGDAESCSKCSDIIGEGATTDTLGSSSAAACACKFGTVRVGDTCINCPEGADCTQRAIQNVAALPGYWRKSLNSTTWHECEQPLGHQVCQAQVTVNKDGDLGAAEGGVSAAKCREGHEGVLCSSCQEGFGKNLGVCTDCSTGIVLPLLLCIFGFLLLFLVLYLVTSEMIRRVNFVIFPSSGLKVEYTGISYLKIFVNFLQMASLASGLKVPKNHSMELMFQIEAIGHLHPWRFEDFECLFPVDFYSKYYYAMLVPVVCIFAAAVFSGLLQVSGVFGNRRIYKDLVVMNAQVLMFLTFSGTAQMVFQIFRCRAIDAGDSVLYADPSISCNTDSYDSARLYGVLFASLYCIGFPLTLLFNTWWLKDKLLERKVYIHYNYFTLNSEENRTWYEAYCMFRKLGIILVVTLVQEDTRRQIFLLSLLSVLYLGIHSYLSPYTKHALNEVESHALFTMAFTYNVCVLFQGASQENGNDFEMIFSWCVISLNIVFAAHCASRILMNHRKLDPITGHDTEDQEAEPKDDSSFMLNESMFEQMNAANAGGSNGGSNAYSGPYKLPKNFEEVPLDSCMMTERRDTSTNVAVSNPLCQDI